MTHARPRFRGFTLLEVLVAIAVFAVFSAMAYGGLLRLLDSRNRVDAERAFWRDATFGFLRIEQDLSLARNRPIRGIDGGERPGFVGHDPNAILLEDPRLEFTRGGVITSVGAASDLQRVGYRLHEGNLVRMSWSTLDRAPTATPTRSTVFRDVESFELRYFTNAGGGWTDQWPPLPIGGANEASPLPDGVEITLRLTSRGEFKRTFLVGQDR